MAKASKSSNKSNSSKKSGKSGGAGKRELIKPGNDKRYVRRDKQGQFSESDDQGKSLSKDVKQKAKKTVSPGQGDKGDQARKKSTTTKKRK